MDHLKLDAEYFPKTVFEALAFEYVKSHNLAYKTPAEIFRMYKTALNEIRKESKNMANKKE